MKLSPQKNQLNWATGLGVKLCHDSWLDSWDITHDSWWSCKIVHWVIVWHQKKSVKWLHWFRSYNVNFVLGVCDRQTMDNRPCKDSALQSTTPVRLGLGLSWTITTNKHEVIAIVVSAWLGLSSLWAELNNPRINTEYHICTCIWKSSNRFTLLWKPWL